MKPLRNAATSLKSILFGLLATLAVNIVSTVIVATLYYVVPGNTQYTIPPGSKRLTIINWVLQIQYYTAPIVGGIITGLNVKQKGWLYGMFLGLVLTIISIIILLLYPITYLSMIPSYKVWPFIWRNTLRILIKTPMIILLTTIGGFIGQRKYEKQ